MGSGETNPTELVAMLICEKESFEAGIHNAQQAIEGSCSLLLLTTDGIYAARDKLGRTPVIIGKKDGGFAASSETCAFPNLGYEIEKYLGPGEIVRMTAEGCEQRKAPQDKMQVCAFCGCTTVIRPPVMKGSMSNRSDIDAARRWPEMMM